MFSRLKRPNLYISVKQNKTHLDEIFMDYFKNVINIKKFILAVFNHSHL